MTEGLPDPSATDLDAPASPLGTPQGYPSGDEDRDGVIELLCDEWPSDIDYREWDDRCALVVRLLATLDANRLTVIDLGDPITTAELRALWDRHQARAAGASDATSAEAGHD